MSYNDFSSRLSSEITGSYNYKITSASTTTDYESIERQIRELQRLQESNIVKTPYMIGQNYEPWEKGPYDVNPYVPQQLTPKEIEGLLGLYKDGSIGVEEFLGEESDSGNPGLLEDYLEAFI